MDNNVIAVVAGKEITEEDFNIFANGFTPEQKAYLQNPETLKYFKDQFVALYLFEEMAKEEKLNETEEYKVSMKNAERDILSQLAMREVLKKAEVTDDEVKKYYEDNKAQFKKPETASAKHILMDSEDEINNVKNDIENGNISFEDAAKKHSTCPSGQEGGDLGEFGRGQMVKEFEDATFSAEIGKIVGPVKTQFGYHLIKVEKRSDAGAASLDEVKESIRQMLMQQKQQEVYNAKVEELKAKYCK